MRVPDKISVAPENGLLEQRDRHVLVRDNNDWMHVPDRILVSGGDKYEAGRSALPEMKLESSILGDHSNEHVQLMTPPRHLTLHDHEYPSVAEANDLNTSQSSKLLHRTRSKDVTFSPMQDADAYGFDNNSPQDGYVNSFYTSNNSVAGMDDTTLLKRQVKSLGRRVIALERDNHQRYQRDVVLYAVGIVYFLMKGISWLNRRW